MNDLQSVSTQLPTDLEDLNRYIVIGREKLVAVKAELRAITKVNLAVEDRNKKLAEAQDLAESLLTAEMRLGELISTLPVAPGKRADLPLIDSSVQRSKKELLQELGITVKSAQRFEALAQHPDVVQRMVALARDEGDIISRTAVLKEISDIRTPYVVHNSGQEEWYTPRKYIDSAVTVMGNIDLDPASTAEANSVVCASQYYDKSMDGLKQPWYGRIFLNPPFGQVSHFVDKLCNSSFSEAIVLTLNGTETRWFRQLVTKSSAVVFLTGRQKFWRPASTHAHPHAPMQGQAVSYIGPQAERFLAEFSKYGWGALLPHD